MNRYRISAILCCLIMFGISFATVYQIGRKQNQIVHRSNLRGLPQQFLQNLIIFSKLYGYVRYFHPSDEAAATNWNNFVIKNIDVIEKAKDLPALRKILDSLFRPIAPTVRIFNTGYPPPLPKELITLSSKSTGVVAWVHEGIDLGDFQLKQVFTDWRLNTPDDCDSNYESTVQQFVSAHGYEGKKIRLKAAIKLLNNKEPNSAFLWIKIGNKISTVGAISPEWKHYEVVDTLPANLQYFEIGCSKKGVGQAWLDEVSLAIIDTSGIRPIEIQNSDFEEQAIYNHIPGWNNISNRHPALLTMAGSFHGKQCVMLSNSPRKDLPVRKPNEPYIADLGGGVSCMVPLALYKDSAGTLPHHQLEITGRDDLGKEQDTISSGDNRTTRIGDIIIAWNIFKHFYPYLKETKKDWGSILPIYLGLAANDIDGKSFFLTFQRFIAEANDGHGRVGYKEYHGSYWNRVPFSWDLIENKLVITQVDSVYDCGLRRGDIVLMIEGAHAEKALSEKEEFVSGATEQWKRFWALRYLPAVEQFSPITMLVQSDSEESGRLIYAFPISGKRPNVTWKFVDDPRPPKICLLGRDVTYVDLTRTSAGEFNDALPMLQNSKGLIFDMRGYPTYADVLSHLIDTTIISQPLLMPIFTRPNQEDIVFDHREWEMTPEKPRLSAKVAFIIDGSVISAGETWMTMVAHYQLGKIIGTPTAGTNGAMNSCMLPGGYYFTFTGEKATQYDGSQFHGIGVSPTIEVQRTIKGVKEGRDEFLEKALESVSGK